MSGRNDGRFNSTMKNNNGHWNNSPNRNNSYYGGRNNSYQGKNNSYSDNRSDRNTSDNRSWNNKSWNPRYNYSDNYDSRRRLNRYKHQPRDPKNKIRFEYNITDKDICNSNGRRPKGNGFQAEEYAPDIRPGEPPNGMLTQLGTILTDLITRPLIIIERRHQSYSAFVVLARCYSITHMVLGSLDQ